MTRLVIVGASLAGLRAAQAARKAGHEGEIVVVGQELHRPYTRPPLSKELLAGDGPARSVALPFPDDLEVAWRLGIAATGLDLEGRTVLLAGDERLAYDSLVLATGCRARAWAGPGADLGGVHTLRDLDDALRLRQALAGRPRLAIVGAGFIGCEVAASARALGLDVTLVDVAPTPMPALGDLLGERCAALHREHGVELRLGVGIEAILGPERVAGVELTDGTRVPAELAVVALGAVVNTEWLQGSGLTLEPGVVCDEHLAAAGAQDVFCAGDIAAWPHALAPDGPVRVEHWTTAAEQGTLAGRNAVVALEERQAYTAVPSFWSDQYDVKIQVVGLPRLAERVRVVESAPGGERFVAVGERAGSVVAALGFNAARRLPWYRKQIAEGASLAAVAEAAATDPKGFGVPAEAVA